MKTFSDEFYLEIAYKEALKAYKHNEIPVGAVIVDNATHKIIAKSYNKKEKNNDVTSHAEINAIRKASKKINNWRLEGCTLYVTLEPCSMCMSAILQARISRVVYILNEDFMGACGSKIDLTKIYDSKTTVFKSGDIFTYKKLLEKFFLTKREK